MNYDWLVCILYHQYFDIINYYNCVNIIGKDKNKLGAPKKSFLGEPSPEDYVLMKEETFNLEPVWVFS